MTGNEWGEAFRARRERAEARRAAAEKVDMMLAAGDARVGAALDRAIARGDRDQVLRLVAALRAAARGSVATRARDAYRDARGGREITRVCGPGEDGQLRNYAPTVKRGKG